MSDHSHLWAACLADPADDTARLVLADLLRESDDSDAQAKGRFLWAGVTAAGFRDADLIDDPHYYAAQAELGAVAASGAPARWLGLLWIGPDPLTRSDWAWDATRDRVTVRIGDTLGTYVRGMLAEVAASLEQWLVLSRLAPMPFS
ncbi:TIGR02996 domain-containing protein [Gemmata sp.]|uniref:TIGR02996 domain-containing protein n=1 Tax=Gemmata sp. TaxID=1914242 RepID=UPI003F6FF52A